MDAACGSPPLQKRGFDDDGNDSAIATGRLMAFTPLFVIAAAIASVVLMLAIVFA
jgi:hypothetical protein